MGFARITIHNAVVRPGLLALALALAMTACGSDHITGPRALRLALVSGDGQAAEAGKPLANPFVVRATGLLGAPIRGVPVTWTVTAGEGALNGEFKACVGNVFETGDPVSLTTVPTDADGLARMSVLPIWFGPITVTATLNGGRERVSFRIDASDPEAVIELVSGGTEEGRWAAFPLHDPFVIRVKNGRGEGVGGLPVAWALTSGEGSLSTPGCNSLQNGALITRTTAAESEGSGYAIVAFSPKGLGPSVVAASLPGVQASPVVFHFNAASLLIALIDDPWFGPGFIGPDYTSQVTIPVGTPIEFLNLNPSARIRSVTAPEGGPSFDSGMMEVEDRFAFVPQMAGTWTFIDEVSGATGTLTAR